MYVFIIAKRNLKKNRSIQVETVHYSYDHFPKENCSVCIYVQVIARIVDGSRFDEFKAMYGETLVSGIVIVEDK